VDYKIVVNSPVISLLSILFHYI